MKRLLAIPLLLLAAIPAACGSSSTTHTTTPSAGGGSSASGAGSATIATKKLPGLGVVLVNSQGRTLYVFAPDKAKKVTCTGSCAQVWPPLRRRGRASD